MSSTSQEARRALTEQRGAELDKWWAINYLRFMNFQDPISPTLSDMPAEILVLVFEPLNTIDSFLMIIGHFDTTDATPPLITFSINFRKVCRSLRAAVEKTELYFDNVSFWVWNDRVEMMLNNLQILYTDDSKGNSIVTHNKKEKIIKGENFMQLAFKDLETMLKHAGKFEFAIFGGEKHAIATHLLNVLKVKKCVHLEEISLSFLSLSDIISILPYCNTRTLESIALCCDDTNYPIEHLAWLDQWKNSKECTIHGSLFDNMPIKHLLHFEYINVEMHTFSLQKLIEIRQTLLRSSTFQQYTIDSEDADPVEVARVFNPDYSGGDEYKFVYFHDDRKFVLKCKNYGMHGWNLVIHRSCP